MRICLWSIDALDQCVQFQHWLIKTYSCGSRNREVPRWAMNKIHVRLRIRTKKLARTNSPRDHVSRPVDTQLTVWEHRPSCRMPLTVEKVSYVTLSIISVKIWQRWTLRICIDFTYHQHVTVSVICKARNLSCTCAKPYLSFCVCVCGSIVWTDVEVGGWSGRSLPVGTNHPLRSRSAVRRDHQGNQVCVSVYLLVYLFFFLAYMPSVSSIFCMYVCVSELIYVTKQFR